MRSTKGMTYDELYKIVCEGGEIYFCGFSGESHIETKEEIKHRQKLELDRIKLVEDLNRNPRFLFRAI